MFLGGHFFQNERFDGHEARQTEKDCEFSDSYTVRVYFSQCTLRIIDICDRLYA